MTLYVTSNWVLCVLTAAGLAAILRWHRFLAVKPSLVVVLVLNVTIQWAAAAQAREIERSLKDPWVFLLLAQGVPFLVLLGSLFTFRRTAYAVWTRVGRRAAVARPGRRRSMAVLLVGMLALVAIYLRYLPLSSTGLYAIVTDPVWLDANQVREESMKLLDNPVPRYAYSFAANVFAPLLAAFAALPLADDLRQRRFLRAAAGAALLLFVLVTVSLTGARANAAMVLLVVLAALALRAGLPIRPLWYLGAGFAVLALPTLLTVLREGQPLSLSIFWRYLTTGIAQRVFVMPMQMGLWHVDYAQRNGFFGIAGVQRLAGWFDVEFVNVANVVANVYSPSVLTSSIANCSYIFSYYAYFGMVSVAIALLGLWVLDMVLIVYAQLDDEWLLPCVAAVSVTATAFALVDYTLVFITNGFALLPLAAFALDRFGRVRFRWETRGARGRA